MSHFPRKRFGQHFLHEKTVIQKIIAAVQPDQKMPIVEIGPGRGALTIPLLQVAGALDVIEIDRDLAGMLIKECEGIGNLNVHIADALKFNFNNLHDQKMKVIGNLPYNISTPLLFHLFEQIDCIREMVFMMQKEVVDRICANKNCRDYGRLTVMVQSQSNVEKLFNINPGAFTPAPKVDSSVVKIIPKKFTEIGISDKTLFNRIVNQAFSHRRKTIHNALKKLVDKTILDELNIASTSRAENLDIQDYIAIANRLYNMKNQ